MMMDHFRGLKTMTSHCIHANACLGIVSDSFILQTKRFILSLPARTIDKTGHQSVNPLREAISILSEKY